MKLPHVPILGLLCLLSALPARAEGIASMTTVTTANHRELGHHKLKVSLQSEKGVTTVHLEIDAGADTPSQGAVDVTIPTELAKKGTGADLMSFDVGYGQRPVKFRLADELVDRAQIRYFLSAGDARTHVFTIEAGELRKLAKEDEARAIPKK